MAPKEMANGYCKACHRIRDREHKRSVREREAGRLAQVSPADIKLSRLHYAGLKPDMCNCLNPACNGLQCDRIT